MTKENSNTIATFTEKGGLQLHTPFVFNDGGRADAGYKGITGDCVTRAIAIATGKPYQEIYDHLAKGNATQRSSKHDRKSRAGVETASRGINTSRKWFKETMKEWGFEWTPTMLIGQGCKVHLKSEELPKGRLVVAVSRHYVAVIDGVIHDIYNADRGGTRCVYGYYTLKQSKVVTSTKTVQPSQEHQSIPETPVKAKKTGKTDADKLSALVDKVKSWNTKKKRADNMLKKLAKKVMYYQKKINKIK